MIKYPNILQRRVLTLKRLKTPVCLLLVLTALLMPACAAEPPAVTAAAAILYEVKSDEVLFEYNADVQRYPASTTKLMTAIVALEHGNITDTVTVSQSALDGLPERGSSVFLIAGEEMSFSDMLPMMLAQTALKTLYEIVVLPVTICVVNHVKRVEETDVYDEGISYNILKVREVA